MSWRLEVRHVTRYRYERPVVASYNEARLTPLSIDRQVVVDARVEVRPPASVFRYWDYWGTLVHAFDLHVPHEELVVTATSLVETREVSTAGSAPTVTWADLDDSQLMDPFYELLTPTRYVDLEAVRDVAVTIRAAAADPSSAVEAAVAWVHEQLVYEKGTTSAMTSAVDAWRAGRGVCQDFVHLTLAVLRALGIPARYASGYFHPDAGASVGSTTVGESHAWLEAWVGEWMPIDPTNRVPVTARHVVVARGRDYSDVSPLRGIYSGSPSSQPEATVEMTRRG